MHKRLALGLLALLLSSSAAEAKRESAEAAYEGARKAYYALKDDAARRKLRHHWLNVARRFESVATRFPKSEHAPEALFTAAELLSELSRLSFVEEDLQAAVTGYTKLLNKYPKHRLADDAALALARIYINRLEQPENARRVLTEAVARHTKGDQRRELKELLASLPAPAKAAPARKSSAKDSEPAVAEQKSQERPAGAGLVDAITKLAREPSPFVPPQAEAPKAAEEKTPASPPPRPSPKKPEAATGRRPRPWPARRWRPPARRTRRRRSR